MNAAPESPARPAGARIPPRFPSVALDRLEHLVLAAADQQLHCVIRFAGRVARCLDLLAAELPT